MDAINLQMPRKIPRTEYSASFYWSLIQAVTGIPVDSSSNDVLKRKATAAFEKAWDFGFTWTTLTGGQVLEKCRTSMGHAVYAEGGTDYDTRISCPFTEAEQVLSFDPWAVYGEQDKGELTRQYNEHYDINCAEHPDQVNMTGIYVTMISGLLEIFGWEMLLEGLGEDSDRFGEAANRYASWIQQYFDALAECKAPVVMIHDDIVWTSGPFVNPAWYRKYIFPNYEKLFDPLHKAGKKILFTSDGTYDAFVDDIAACGVSGFVMEPTTDMEYIAKKYGRTHAFVGNADCRILTLGTKEDIRREVIALQDMRHKRLALEAGEDPVRNTMDYYLKSIETIYSIKHKNGAIRRVNINIAATTVDNYRLLKEAGIGTYILFQETYHKESYLKLHPTGPKHDYNYHTEAMDRAMEGGIDDVGCGVLFGLEMYRYEFTGLLMHAEHLEAVYGVGPHTISVPRVKRADDIDPDTFDNGIDDDTFAKIIACIRIAVPYTGMIISTRENQKCRERVLHLGISQISGGSRTSVGGYVEPEPEDESSEQFEVSDNRTLDEVVNWLMGMGYVPSFCTACYREGRTGDRFMSLCKSGQIQNCCLPNALMTLKEYLMDYASPDTVEKGLKLIQEQIKEIPRERTREIVQERLIEIEKGNRDFRF